MLTDQPHPFIIRLFEYFQENSAFLKAILGSHGDSSFEGKLRNILGEKMFKNASNLTNGAALSVPLELLIQFMTSAQVGVIRYWLNSGMQQSPEELATIMFQILSKGPLEASGLKKYIVEEGSANRDSIF